MKTITKKTDVYKYDELDDAAKENVMQRFSDINIDYGWWDGALDSSLAVENMKQAGIEVDEGGLSFDLGRDNYLYFSKYSTTKKTEDGHAIRTEHTGIYIEDQDKLADALAKDKTITRKVANAIRRGDISLGVSMRSYGGGDGKNVLELNAETDKGYELVDTVDHDAVEDWLYQKTQDIQQELQKQYDYLRSEEAIVDTIRANECDFTVDGASYA